VQLTPKQPTVPTSIGEGAPSPDCDIFISYSRKDQAFVKELEATLTGRGITVWIDWRDIAVLAPDWLEEVRRAIDAADNFLFVISPDALNSAHCLLELQHALSSRKRLAPVRYRDVGAESMAAMPEELRRPNWIVPLEGDLNAIAEQIEAALNTDHDFVREHRRLLVQCRDWTTKGEPSSLLLRGPALLDAEAWVRKSGTVQEPSPTADQLRLIDQSIGNRRLWRSFYLLIALIVFVVVVRWFWMRTDAYQAHRVLTDAPALIESADDSATGAWCASLLSFGRFDIPKDLLWTSKDSAVTGAPQARTAEAFFEANQFERGMQMLESIIGSHYVSGERVYFPSELPVRMVLLPIPFDVERARNFVESTFNSNPYVDRLWFAKDLLDKHDLPFAKHVFDEAIDSARQIPNRIARIAALGAIADVVKVWPPQFRDTAVYATEVESDTEDQQFIVSPVWVVMARNAARAGKQDRAQKVLSKQIAAIQRFENPYIKAAALISLIEPLHLTHHPGEGQTQGAAAAAVLAISSANLRSAEILRLCQALVAVGRKGRAVEILTSESKESPPTISLESALAESRLSEGWAVTGNSGLAREHLVRAVVVAQSLRQQEFRSMAYSAAGFGAAHANDRRGAFYSCEQAWRAISDTTGTSSEKDESYGRVVRLLAELHDISDVRMDVMSESIRKIQDTRRQYELTESITKSLVRRGAKVPTLLLLNDALEYSVTAETLAGLGHANEALSAIVRAEDKLSRNKDDRYESRVRMHLANALAQLGNIGPAVEMANRCRFSADRLVAFSGIITAYAPRQSMLFRIWPGL
jgi:hypothetical protein